MNWKKNVEIYKVYYISKLRKKEWKVNNLVNHLYQVNNKHSGNHRQ